MKVILLADIRGLGKKLEVKEVSNGHARNFLFPKNFAKPATPGELQKLEKRRVEAAQENVALIKHLTELARRLNGRFVEFQLKTDQHGSVFGSVTKEMILKAMREHNLIGKERVEIELAHPLKAFGDYKIPVEFKKDIRATLTVSVRPQP